MSDPRAHDTPDLDDVMQPTEAPQPDRREHAKKPPRPDDDLLEERTREERETAGLPTDGQAGT